MKTEHGLIVQEHFIVFGEDFSRHPHALEHLLRPLFPSNRFLWVETIGLRSPTLSLYDLKRIVEKLGKWLAVKKKEAKNPPPPNVIVISPFMIPFNKIFLIRKFNQLSVTRAVKKALAAHEFTAPIWIASVPQACDFTHFFKEKMRIYFCVDEFSLWPGMDHQLVGALEKKLIENVDLIIATSDTLATAKTLQGKATPVISHGVDFEHFSKKFPLLVGLPFKICYFGLFDERTNQEVILQLAQGIPGAEIHIIGNVVCDTKKLKEEKNIFFHGPVSYQHLPEAISIMDVFILPYLKNDLTHFINPLKLKEYLSTGKPVVAIDLPEVIKLKSYLFVAPTPSDFVRIISDLKDKRQEYDAQRVLDYVKQNETWQAKAVLLSAIINGRAEHEG